MDIMLSALRDMQPDWLPWLASLNRALRNRDGEPDIQAIATASGVHFTTVYKIRRSCQAGPKAERALVALAARQGVSEAYARKRLFCPESLAA